MTEKWYFVGEDFSSCKKVRDAVFVNEQGISPREVYDALDFEAVHLVYFDGNEPIAAGRIVQPGDTVYKIGRLAVLKQYRKQGLGKRLVEDMINYAEGKGGEKIEVGAQLRAVGFYKKLGFEAIGEEYEEIGVPHIRMIKIL